MGSIEKKIKTITMGYIWAVQGIMEKIMETTITDCIYIRVIQDIMERNMETTMMDLKDLSQLCILWLRSVRKGAWKMLEQAVMDEGPLARLVHGGLSKLWSLFGYATY